MTLEELETRLTKAEQAIEALQADAPARRRWWERPRPDATPVMEEDLKVMEAYSKYIRRTGNSPPPDWKPGDPIPDPDHWS